MLKSAYNNILSAAVLAKAHLVLDKVIFFVPFIEVHRGHKFNVYKNKKLL